jgi:CBS domain-containing protein
MGLMRLAQDTPTVAPETSVTEAVRIMTERRVGALAVVTGRRRMGIFTERDLMRRVVCVRKDPDATLMREVMSSPVKTVADATSVNDAVSLMRAYHIRHLAIVDERGDLLGLVGQRYMLYELMDNLERKVDSLESFIMADALGG